MAFDGGFLAVLRKEIEQKVLHCRVDKVYQPARDELVLVLRGREFSGKLLLCCGPRNARVQLTDYAPENPASPPMLCMLLRKHLVGARLSALVQPGLERVLMLRFDARNELGDDIVLTLVVELMGRRSNFIFCDPEMRVIDAVRRTDAMDSVRVLMPGVKYEMPPAQDKADILLSAEPSDIVDAVQQQGECDLADALLRCVQGASPLVCREIAHRAVRGAQVQANALDQEQQERLRFYLAQWAQQVTTAEGIRPTMVLDPSGKPLDFTFMDVTQYGRRAVTRTYDTLCALLDGFYVKREQAERLQARSQDLLKLLTTLTSRISRRVNIQRSELSACADREHLRQYGELLKANLHLVERGAPFCEVVNFYSPDCEKVRIPLDVALTPAQNAQKYFKDYRKAHAAEQHLTGLIEQGVEELHYLESVFEELARAKSDREIAEIREEMCAQGYLKKNDRKSAPKTGQLAPFTFRSEDGFQILVGRNNRQNDQLTLKQAHGNDLWLHTKDIPGAHVIVISEGRQIPDRTIEQAAILAACHSKAADSSLVPVDYCPVKRVKKPQGATPGRVIYENYRTAFVKPDAQLCEQLRELDDQRRKEK